MNRKNEVSERWFLNQYEKYGGHDNSILGFPYKGLVYACEFEKLPMRLLKKAHESSSKGGYMKLRISWTETNKKYMINKGKAKAIMTLEELEAIQTKKNTNMGHKFEKFFAMKYIEENATWKEGGNDRFDKCGDVVINGKQVQIKYNDASLTNINVIHNVQNENRKLRKVS